ncbi:hypothetical protein K432DRAFT_87852 [Lepidopterella palustris CBS 459.81]|uniref:Dpy-30 domain-containing protein n=1 Tax=Lepidopterella palustris CBS 459.81 TaxID=1314670 RepID=A0A8E2E785_9PEZI|nr:hypothetical protein K432DRAFT_87852 [Lepidopterella palustris CBS 459.81]
MADASPVPNNTDPASIYSEPTANGTTIDIEMKEEAQLDSHPADPYTPSALPTTPLPHTNSATTPAARSSPHPGQTTSTQPPIHPNPHGSPTRVYLNQNVTPHLLEGMKHLVTQEPEKPLKWLSEFLAEKSREIEG